MVLGKSNRDLMNSIVIGIAMGFASALGTVIANAIIKSAGRKAQEKVSFNIPKELKE